MGGAAAIMCENGRMNELEHVIRDYNVILRAHRKEVPPPPPPPSLACASARLTHSSVGISARSAGGAGGWRGVSSRLIVPQDDQGVVVRALSGRLKFTARRHKFNKDSLVRRRCLGPTANGWEYLQSTGNCCAQTVVTVTTYEPMDDNQLLVRVPHRCTGVQVE